MRQVQTFCRICSAHCGLSIRVDGEQIVEVAGDRLHPLSQGYTCAKGRQLGRVHVHERRLDHPLARRGEKLARVTWGESIDEVEARIRVIIRESGAGAIGHFAATASAYDANGRGITAGFFAGLRTRQLYSSFTLDAPNKPLCAGLIAGRGVIPLVDWDHTRCLLLVGTNPPVSHGHGTIVPNPVERIRAVRRRGGHVIVVDPRRTKSARLADLHLALRPSTDDFLLAGLVRALLREGADEQFIQERVAGVETLRKVVEPFPLERVARLCALRLEDLETAVRFIREAGRCSVLTGTGVSMGPAANAGEALAWSLGAVTGSLDREGGFWFNPGLLKPTEEHPLHRGAAERPGPASRPDLRGFGGELPAVALADEIEAGNLRALFVVGANPALICPEAKRIGRALRSLELLVVSDIFHTATTALATHVWPCTDQLERADLSTYVDNAYPAAFAQYAPRVVPPRGERRGMWWPFFELSRRLQLPVLGKPEVDAALPELPDDDTFLALAAKRARVPFSEIVGSPHGVLDREAPRYGWMTRRLPGGRWNLDHPVLFERLNETREAEAGELRLLNRRVLATMNTTLSEPDLRGEEPDLLMNAEDGAARGLADGGWVRVRSRHGELEARVRWTDEIPRGSVSIPHGFGDPNVNHLTSARADLDPLTGMPRLTGIPVALEPIELAGPCSRVPAE